MDIKDTMWTAVHRSNFQDLSPQQEFWNNNNAFNNLVTADSFTNLNLPFTVSANAETATTFTANALNFQ